MTVMLTYNVCVGTCHRSSFVVISSCESQTLVHTPSLSLPHTHFSFSLCGRKVAFKLSPWRRRGCISGVQEVSPRVEWCSNHLKTNPAAMKFHHKGPAACVCVCTRATRRVCARCDKNVTEHLQHAPTKSVSKWRTKPTCSGF